MGKIYELSQEFKFNNYENYVVKFERKPQYRDDAIFVYIQGYECIIDKKTGDILEAWECGDQRHEDKKEKVSNLFSICGYTKDKLVYIADFIYGFRRF